MPGIYSPEDIKRKIRKLKQLEIKIRFNGMPITGASLVWDKFFDLRGAGGGNAKYTLQTLAAMSKEEYKKVIDEFFSYVYYEHYKENGLTFIVRIFDPEILSCLGLPSNADDSSIKKRFRELAKIYHPDVGGDPAKFIELMENYQRLTQP